MKWVVFWLIVCALAATALGASIYHVANLPKASDAGGMLVFPFLITVFAGCGVAMVASMETDKVPPNWLEQVGRDPALLALGNPIPQDAVDRRWLKHIRDAAQLVPMYPPWPDNNPVATAEEQSRREACMRRVTDLIEAARKARGVRLPVPVTYSDD